MQSLGGSWRGAWVALGGQLGLLAVLGLAGSASAVSACVGNPSISQDGTVVYGSACADRIVVTSPQVRKVIGSEGDDTIFVNPNVEVVDGGAGDDTIYGELPETEIGGAAAEGVQYVPLARPSGEGLATVSLTPKNCEAGKSCYGGLGSQELIGSSGNDKIFGQRGNDALYGNAGDDQLFGGVGDESTIAGGSGNDLLSGGLGTDYLNGNQESDLVRGDGTIDTVEDTGSSGTDTLSFATAVSPGFHGVAAPTGFPADSDGEERGVYVRLDGTGCSGEYEACNNEARYGGGYDNVGVDTTSTHGFENVVGSPFADVIVGSNVANRIDGGGGTDEIYGKGGNDEIYGGADGDYMDGEEGADTVYGQGGEDNCIAETKEGCSGEAKSVDQRDRSKISVGYMVDSPPGALGWVAVYLTGSTGHDEVTATLSLDGGGTGHVVFVKQGTSASFDTSSDAITANCEYSVGEVACTLPRPLDAIVLAGMDGDDKLTLSAGEQYWETTTPTLLGGQGDDEVFGSGNTEDVMVDGPGSGSDDLYAYGYDDALINNEGADNLQGGAGNDLLISTSNCNGDVLQGAESGVGDGSAQNSASWAQYAVSEGATGVIADLEKGKAGNTWSGSNPACSGGTVSTVLNMDDLEGSTGQDQLYGDGAPNNLLGRLGKDEIWGRAGDDRIEAKDGIAEVGGGSTGTDSCELDGSDSFNSCNP